MKFTKKLLVLALTCATIAAFVGCKDPSNEKTEENDTTEKENLVIVFEGKQTVTDWGNIITIDHDKITNDTKKVRVTFSDASDEGAFKVTVADPWTEGTVETAKGGNLQDDNGVGITGNGTVDLTFKDGMIAKFIGEGHDGAWGGMAFQGQNCTITKIELIK